MEEGIEVINTAIKVEEPLDLLKCDQCDKRFTCPGNLEAHTAVTHEGKSEASFRIVTRRTKNPRRKPKLSETKNRRRTNPIQTLKTKPKFSKTKFKPQTLSVQQSSIRLVEISQLMPTKHKLSSFDEHQIKPLEPKQLYSEIFGRFLSKTVKNSQDGGIEEQIGGKTKQNGRKLRDGENMSSSHYNELSHDQRKTISAARTIKKTGIPVFLTRRRPSLTPCSKFAASREDLGRIHKKVLSPPPLRSESAGESPPLHMRSESSGESPPLHMISESGGESPPLHMISESSGESPPLHMRSESSGESPPLHTRSESKGKSPQLTFAQGKRCPAPGESVEPVPGESVEPAPGESVEPAPGESVEPVPGESVEPAPGESVEPAQGGSVEPVPGESVEPAPGESVEPAPGESVEPAPGESVEPAPGGNNRQGEMEKYLEINLEEEHRATPPLEIFLCRLCGSDYSHLSDLTFHQKHEHPRNLTSSPDHDLFQSINQHQDSHTNEPCSQLEDDIQIVGEKSVQTQERYRAEEDDLVVDVVADLVAAAHVEEDTADDHAAAQTQDVPPAKQKNPILENVPSLQVFQVKVQYELESKKNKNVQFSLLLSPCEPKQSTTKFIKKDKNRVQCDVCEKTLKSSRLLRKHKKLSHNTIYKCLKCNFSTRVKFSLTHHNQLEHCEKRVYYCDYPKCCTPFPSRVQQRDHQILVHGQIFPSPHKCRKCGCTFRLKHLLRLHRWKCTKTVHYQCKLCHFGSRRTLIFRKHLQSRHNLTPTNMADFVVNRKRPRGGEGVTININDKSTSVLKTSPPRTPKPLLSDLVIDCEKFENDSENDAGMPSTLRYKPATSSSLAKSSSLAAESSSLSTMSPSIPVKSSMVDKFLICPYDKLHKYLGVNTFHQHLHDSHLDIEPVEVYCPVGVDSFTCCCKQVFNCRKSFVHHTSRCEVNQKQLDPFLRDQEEEEGEEEDNIDDPEVLFDKRMLGLQDRLNKFKRTVLSRPSNQDCQKMIESMRSRISEDSRSIRLEPEIIPRTTSSEAQPEIECLDDKIDEPEIIHVSDYGNAILEIDDDTSSEDDDIVEIDEVQIIDCRSVKNLRKGTLEIRRIRCDLCNLMYSSEQIMSHFCGEPEV